ncbi:CPBP family intramembrane metalloprotease [Aphanothece hegewaldii CCALA 016]|uniref:CPBP family intramembrane metalloprotease n=2 Tax=Aphanothece TaxID=1121 RepID=A0A2T1LWA3_9CHRO|nr:CPBP family intramembrane glutamic endopeptidase [Aphanothece hegewaldii]PSF36179.1 CPBP family intramembrane metalloprotease [Aphanothece hegewaldii CCALA 016]
MSSSDNPEFEPLTRKQILIIMGVTAVILLLVARIWQYFGSIKILDVQFSLQAVWLSLALAFGISLGSGLMYRIWPAYRQSADTYLELVIKPLVWPDLIWLGLLPGLSEELLFRGVMLPALGLDLTAVIVSSCLFGILHFSGSQQWPYVLWATVVGLVLGYSAMVTGNLLVPTLAHIVTNLVASYLWKARQSLNPPSL